MTKDEALALLKSSNSADEWDANCEKIKAAHGGQYPEWWYPEVVMSTLVGQAAAKFGGDADIHITPIDPKKFGS